ncbi:MAG: sel1 repeat family protein [Gammaproteobacteria bacterium]|nr:sel1 repeat family protein [Gammaproteobacteria bacterium]
MHSRHNQILSIIAGTLLLFSTAWAGFEQSHEAYTKGDYTTAFNGYLEAANSGDSRAFGKVAALYLYGRGIEKDYSQAYIWFGIAKYSKDKYATKFQETAASMLTREQIKQAALELEKKREALGIKLE